MATKIGFLLGSGISLKAGLPTTKEITKNIISGEGIIRHTDGSYYLGNCSKNRSCSYIGCCKSLISLLNVKLAIFNSKKIEFNYEDLYFIIDQIYNSIIGEFENPIADQFMESLKPDVEMILHNDPSETENRDYEWLMREAKHYIQDIVWRMLLKKTSSTNYLKSISDSCLDADIEKVDLFTLNHDLLLESFLEKQRIEYDIGFGPKYNDVRYWNPMILEESNKKVRLIKLHGSINWIVYRANKYSSRNYSVGLVDIGKTDIWYTKSPSGDYQNPIEGRPQILIGTSNKILQYSGELFIDLHSLFRRSLREIDHLIICGYGFGDKGINSQVNAWMYLPSVNHMTIIHPEPDNLLKNARGLIQKNWESWEKEGQLTIINKKIEDTSWVEIKRTLMNKCQESS